jgi:hypothetical protein
MRYLVIGIYKTELSEVNQLIIDSNSCDKDEALRLLELNAAPNYFPEEGDRFESVIVLELPLPMLHGYYPPTMIAAWHYDNGDLV